MGTSNRAFRARSEGLREAARELLGPKRECRINNSRTYKKRFLFEGKPYARSARGCHSCVNRNVVVPPTCGISTPNAC